jgi:hypothetical protein
MFGENSQGFQDVKRSSHFGVHQETYFAGSLKLNLSVTFPQAVLKRLQGSSSPENVRL